MDEVSPGAMAVVRALRYFFAALAVIMVLCVAYYFVSGFYIVESGENVIVKRFGRKVDVKENADWYFAWPKPIDRKVRINVSEKRKFEELHFWYKEQPQTVTSDPSQRPTVDENQPLRSGDGGYCLSADQNIIHTKWSVVYNIEDSFEYHTGFYRGPSIDRQRQENHVESAIRLILRDAIVREVARMKVDTILSDAEDQLRTNVRRRVRRKLATMDLGLDSQAIEVYLEQKTVPLATSKAFSEVVNATSQRSTTMNEARSYATEKAEEAKSEARQILEQAEAYKDNVERTAAADAEYLQSISKQYEKSGISILLPHYVDTLNRVLDQAEQVLIVYPEQELRITVEPRLEKPRKNEDKKGQ